LPRAGGCRYSCPAFRHGGSFLEVSPSPVYGARLLSGLRAQPSRGFKSRHLRPDQAKRSKAKAARKRRHAGGLSSGPIWVPNRPTWEAADPSCDLLADWVSDAWGVYRHTRKRHFRAGGSIAAAVTFANVSVIVFAAVTEA
jgi:hypothetical protein